MSLGMVQLGNAARSTPCFNEKRNLNFNQTLVEAYGSARHSQFCLCTHKQLQKKNRSTSYYNLIGVPWVNKIGIYIRQIPIAIMRFIQLNPILALITNSRIGDCSFASFQQNSGPHHAHLSFNARLDLNTQLGFYIRWLLN